MIYKEKDTRIHIKSNSKRRKKNIICSISEEMGCPIHMVAGCGTRECKLFQLQRV